MGYRSELNVFIQNPGVGQESLRWRLQGRDKASKG